MRYEVFTQVIIKIFLQDVNMYNVVDAYRRFRKDVLPPCGLKYALYSSETLTSSTRLYDVTTPEDCNIPVQTFLGKELLTATYVQSHVTLSLVVSCQKKCSIALLTDSTMYVLTPYPFLYSLLSKTKN
jgi:hypothetical protein